MRRATPFSLTHFLRWHWLALAAILVASTGCDQWTKRWAETTLSEARPTPPSDSARSTDVCAPDPRTGFARYQRAPTTSLSLVPEYLELTYAENCGGAWSMLARAPSALRVPFFTLAALIAAVALFGMYRKLPPHALAARAGIPLILGGALGNVLDRITRGYVIDFVHAHWRDRIDYPVFNVADVCIAVGIALLVLSSVRPGTPVAVAHPAG